MKVTKSYIKQIIQEELEHSLDEEELQQEGWKELVKSLKHGYGKGKEAGAEAERSAKEKYVEDPEAMSDRETTGTLAKLKAGIGTGVKAAKEKYGQEMADKSAYEKEVGELGQKMAEPGEVPIMKTVSRVYTELQPLKKQYDRVLKKHFSQLSPKQLYNIFVDVMKGLPEAEVYSNFSAYRKNPHAFTKKSDFATSRFPAQKATGLEEEQ